MPTAKLTPREIVERLSVIDALTAEGRPLTEVLRIVGMTEVAHGKWRVEFAGLMRTLGPMSTAPEMPRKPRGRPAPRGVEKPRG